jgi:cytochrome c biogenesis protein CcmG/thiol:disulfide interchange protein DsbE
MAMKMKWVLASVGAVALAAVAITSAMPWLRHTETHVSAEACPLDAKPANLNFTLKDMNEKEVSLASYAGKVILLDFWATWCGPCKVEIPGFVEMQNTYGPQGLQVIGISTDDRPEQLKPFAAEFKMNYPVLQGLGRDDVTDAFGPVFGLPTTIIISRDGKICASHAGMTAKETFETQIKELL